MGGQENKMMKIKNWINVTRVVCCSILILGCSKSFDRKIADYIDESCKATEQESCVVDLNQITDFEWDRMFVFGGVTISEEISEAIGFDCACDAVQDNYMRIVFLKDRKIVMESEYYGLDGKVQFRQSKEGGDFLLYQSTSKFHAVKKSKSIVEGQFYDLFPID